MGTDPYYKKKSEQYHAKRQSRIAEALKMRDTGNTALMPHTVDLAMNNACNLQCSHCDVGTDKRNKSESHFFASRTMGNRKLQELPLEVLKRLVDEVAPNDTVIRPTFLEPMLRKDLFEFAQYVKDKGLVFSLQTNGTLLPKYYKQPVDLGIDQVRVSLDGPPEIHDRIRGVPNTFEKMIGGLEQMLEYREKKNVKAPNVGLSYVISGANYTKINETMALLEKRGLLENVFIAFCLLRFVTKKEACQMNEIDYDFYPMTESSLKDAAAEDVDTKMLTSDLEQLLAKYPRPDYTYHFFPTELGRDELGLWYHSEHFFHPETMCHVPWTQCQVLYNGDVVVNGRCCSPPLGNIMDQSLEAIWNGEIAQSFRAKLKELGNFPACNRCCRKLEASILEK